MFEETRKNYPLRTNLLTRSLARLLSRYSNPERSLREMSRVLKPNGKISMITASMPSFSPEWIKWSSLIKKKHLHHRHFETEELREMLKQNELMDTKAKSCGAFLLVEARKMKPTTPSYISAYL